ncbi:MAG: lipopolysaccharide biosynthesis protein RfbH [Lachnospiraceae bacterium]|nr:lipopolysaccharide biosynthesis protein RfbH [Lachnospiraceae bacterium]
MFENMSEKEAREQILEMVEAYTDRFHAEKPYRDGDRIAYASRVFDREEMRNLVDSSLDFWLTAGRYTNEFEQKLGEYLGVRYVSFVNSGSSANLNAFMALTSPLLKERQIRKGDEVITVACSFPTTVAPIIQYGAVPVFLDVTLPTYNIDTAYLEEARSEKTKAVFVAHTLGNPFNLEAVKAFCDKYGLWLIEDNCDALGSRYTLNGETRFTGTFGDIGTASFYPAHHMTTGEGGAVFTNNALLHKLIRSFRDWGRDCVCPGGMDNVCGHRYDGQFGELPRGYDHKYVYSHFGYNLKATDMQAAIGCAQLKKLPYFTERRQENYRYLYDHLKSLEDKLILPEKEPNADPSWFGFLLTCRNGLSRKDVVSYLEDRGVQTRMLFSGNLLRHPCFDEIRGTDAYRTVGELKNTEIILENTFWIGTYPGMTEEKCARMVKLIHEAVKASEETER